MAHCITVTLGGVTAEDNAIKQLVLDTYNSKNEIPLASINDVTDDHINDYYCELTHKEVRTNEQRNAEKAATYTEFS